MRAQAPAALLRSHAPALLLSALLCAGLFALPMGGLALAATVRPAAGPLHPGAHARLAPRCKSGGFRKAQARRGGARAQLVDAPRAGSARVDMRAHRHPGHRGAHLHHRRCLRESPQQAEVKSDRKRALSLFEAMQRYFYIPAAGLYKEELGATSSSFLWPFSQALAATISVAHFKGELSALLPTLHNQLGALQQYLTDAVPTAVASREALSSLPHYEATVAAVGAGGTAFYDDNDWVGIELVRLYQLTHEEAPLALAEQIMTFEMTGWDTNPSAPCPGGIPHSDAPEVENRSTISTAPAAELAVMLFRITHVESYLAFARSAYAWVRACLLDPQGLYSDHIEGDGEVDPELWSYTQGVMIGAGTLLYEVTGEPHYIYEADATAQAAQSYFTLERLAVENPFFVSVYLRNLLYFDALERSEAGKQVAEEYLSWAWESLHEANGLILTATGAPTVLLGQSAYVQIYALLTLEPAAYF
jgi:hypothetical protein